ncbi:SPOR domain-containing protein [Vibrio sonorensis]|uniref:SPOR domain-containing protein n=1 Tax=Vibrio sonorensis TaxID=1004316 RepID=UPI0008D9D832|nr:SPOR domain-containing protein [Vibrio sonorensis]
MAVWPRKPFLALLAISAIASVSMPATADDFLCDATQASSSELPILDASCPIGKGLWGKQAPAANVKTFWIQCGMFSKPLPLDKAKPLYKQIKTDVWAKPEKKGYRCLIGPYDSVEMARKDLKGVNTVAGYEKAFIRQVVGKESKQGKSAPKSAAKPVSKPAKPAAKKVASAKAPVVPKPQKTTVITPPQTNSTALKGAIADFDVSIRRSTEIAGVSYSIPYFMHGKEQFYMEHGLPWNRMDYNEANLTCKAMGKRLPSSAEWQQLLESDAMTKEKWPMHLPYWGLNKVGLFTSGKVNQLKGTSLLNIMCVQ